MSEVCDRNRVPAGIGPRGGQFAAGSQARAAVNLGASSERIGHEMFYITAHDAGRRALIAGPFASKDAAEAITGKARRLLSSANFTDTLGAFVEVGVTGANPRPGHAIPRGTFNEQLMPPPQLKSEMTSRDVIVAGLSLDKATLREMDRLWFRGNAPQRDAAIQGAWEAVKGTELEDAWRETTLLSPVIRFAAVGAATRHLVGTGGYRREHYDLLTEPWRKVVGPISAGDPDPRSTGGDYGRHEELAEARAEARAERIYADQDEYGRYEIDYDDPRNMDLYDGD